MPFYDSNVTSLLGTLLKVKLRLAIVERDRQKAAWEEFNNVVSDMQQGEWLKLAEDWECDKSLPNPYINVKHGKHCCTHTYMHHH